MQHRKYKRKTNPQAEARVIDPLVNDFNKSFPAKAMQAVVRCHLVDPDENPRVDLPFEKEASWPIWLVFDTETNPDEFASLRFGTYIVEWLNPMSKEIERLDAGFFTGESLTADEVKQIEEYCNSRNLTRMTRREWLEKVFFRYGYRARGSIVGFNLPFDISRVAASVLPFRPPKERKKLNPKRKKKVQKKNSEAKKKKYWLNLFVGGWRFSLFEYEKKGTDRNPNGQWRVRAYRPALLMKQLTSRACMYRFQYYRNWQEKGAFYPGHFLDLRTLGCALSGEKNGSLASFGELFGASVRKIQSDEHGGEITEAYLDYAMNDAEATLSLYHAEMEEYKNHQLDVLPDRIYSGASLGKAYLRTMGLTAPPILDIKIKRQTRDEIMGFAASAYYGGLSAAQIVKMPVPVTYLDFHAMYPAVCVLQGLWDLMKAQKVVVRDATVEVHKFMKSFQPDDLYIPETWKKFNILCLVEPQDDLLPVRGDFRRRQTSDSPRSRMFAMAEVKSAPPMWYPLADVLNSFLMTGRIPRILRALKFRAAGSKPLKSIAIRGEASIDPNREDFFRVLVKGRDALASDNSRLAEALKIVANSTSYGIWIEQDVEEGERRVSAYGTEKRNANIPHGEKPGAFYFPPFAALITAGGRLLLQLLEGEITQRGGRSAFCDTDSLAIVSTEKGGMISHKVNRGHFHEFYALSWAEVDDICNKFESLNPFQSGKPLIKLEKENYEDKDPTKARINLFAYVIAAKRYTLYIPPDHIVKVSYHVLGTVEPPFEIVESRKVEIEDWIEEFWRHIVTGKRFNPHWASQIVEYKTDITTPPIWKTFQNIKSGNTMNTGNLYLDKYICQVKPFNFLAVLAKAHNFFLRESKELKNVPVIAPVELDHHDETRQWFSKNTGQLVYTLQGNNETDRQAEFEEVENSGLLVTTPLTFADLMADYQSHFERKAFDYYGQETSRDTLGQLAHPQVKISDLIFTGKETVLQEEHESGLISDDELDKNRITIQPEWLLKALRLLKKAELKRLGIGWRTTEKIRGGGDCLRVNLRKSEISKKLIQFLREQYPEDVGDVDDDEILRVFVENRRSIMERWKDMKSKLGEVSTKELMMITGLSKREVIRIKKGEVVPGIEIIRRITETDRL